MRRLATRWLLCSASLGGRIKTPTGVKWRLKQLNQTLLMMFVCFWCMLKVCRCRVEPSRAPLSLSRPHVPGCCSWRRSVLARVRPHVPGTSETRRWCYVIPIQSERGCRWRAIWVTHAHTHTHWLMSAGASKNKHENNHDLILCQLRRVTE